jgi:AbrB family looped-hinge helix DNA binding protein
MPMAILTSKGRITIPKAVREDLGLITGDRVDFVEREPNVYTVVAVNRDIRDLKGIVAKPPVRVSADDMSRNVRRRSCRDSSY